MKIFFLMKYDSFVTTLTPVIRHIISLGIEPEVALLVLPGKNWVTSKVTNQLEGISYEILTRKQVRSRAKRHYDVAVIGTVGGRSLHRFIRKFRKESPATRIITGYAGMLLNNNYRGFLHGLRGRLGSNIIWTPGETSRQKVLSSGLIRQGERVMTSGIPRFDNLFKLSMTWANNRDRTQILFIEQPTFPKRKHDRFKLAKFLCDLARVESECTVVLKPRFSKRIPHTHAPKHLMQEMIETMPDTPANLVVSYEHLYDHLPQTKYAISISSTGAVESMLVGIDTFFIHDFCGKKNKYGSNDFKDAGSVVSMDRLLKQERSDVNLDFARSIFRFDGLNTERLANLVLYNQMEKP